jgi:hypothetical protein
MGWNESRQPPATEWHWNVSLDCKQIRGRVHLPAGRRSLAASFARRALLDGRWAPAYIGNVRQQHDAAE